MVAEASSSFSITSLTAREVNQVAAKISVAVALKNEGFTPLAGKISAAVFEVGHDGGQPDSPVAVAQAPVKNPGSPMASAELELRIGTPFYWTEQTPYRYALVVSLEQDRKIVGRGELVFILRASGEIAVASPLKRISDAPSELNPQLPSLFVVSDSTAFSNGLNQLGWGDCLGKFFDTEKIKVLNRARPGRSTRSFRNEGLWYRALAEVKAGDFILLQFGHNDADKLGEGRCRGVLPGLGEETVDVTMPGGAKETVRTYGWYLWKLVAETKARGATPILLSLTAKNIWANGRLQRDQGDYGRWAGQVARAAAVDFIDLTRLIADRYDALGHEKVQTLFCSASDNVHTSPAGAALNAECVATGLKQLGGLPLGKFIL